MKRNIYSTILAWVIMALAVVAVVVLFIQRENWWQLGGIFFGFLAAFCNLLSHYMTNVPALAQKLKFTTVVLGILCVVTEGIIWAVSYF